MSTVEFLSRLREIGIQLWLEGDALRYQAPRGVVTNELLNEIATRKSDVIDFLKQINNEIAAVKEQIPMVSRDDRNELPLSFSQQSMWFFDRFSKSNPVFNICNVVQMNGLLDKDSLKKAINEIVIRHEILRTTFENIDGMPVQIIHAASPIEIPEIDFRNIPDVELEYKLKTAIKEEARRIFNLEQGPLFRFCLFVLNENKYVFSMTIHHIISDAWSNTILIGELFKLYESYIKGVRLTLPQIQIQYADYSTWERKRYQNNIPEELLEYWSKQLANPTTLQLPVDFPRPKSKDYEGGFQAITVTPFICDKLKTICKTEGATLFMVVLSAFQTLLHRYSGQPDIFTGTVVANRNRMEVENLAGFFMNTLVLRTSFENEPSFIEVLRRVKKMTLDAYTHQELPFDKLLEEIKPERDVSMTPLFQVMFILHNTQKLELELPGLKMRQLAVESDMAPFDLRLQLTETDDGLVGGFDFSTALFKHATVKRMSEHLLNIIEYIANTPYTKISEIPMLTEAEQSQIIDAFNNTYAYYPKDRAIYQFFEEQAERIPDSVAVIFEDKQLTYKQLNEKSNQLARVLQAKGVTQGSIIGIMLERSIEMIIGIMAIEKASGTYLPIDPHYPEDRIKFILEDSCTCILLSNKEFDSIDTLVGTEKIFLEDESLYTGDNFNLNCKVDTEGIAYIIYTSGSTGRPKGTMIKHHSLINRLNWMQKQYPIGSNDTILQKTTFTFDVSVWEMFWWGMQGARVCFLESGAEKDPGKIVAAIEKNNINTIHFVPSMLSVFLEYLKDTGEAGRVLCLKQVFASGEALTPTQVGLFNSIMGNNGTKLTNLYGPTEATIDVSYFDCDIDTCANSVPIGKPIDNIQLYVTDRELNLQPVGVPGELCIAGAGLAEGYLNRPDLTQEKFVDNPFKLGEKLYRTGDLVKWREDGNIEYLGRMDFQVKIRGLRIELGEIENAILLHADIKECVVKAWEKKPGDLHLVAYIVYDKEKSMEALVVQRFLEKTLPEYMIPRIYVFLEAMPLSLNGKVDRKALPKPVLEKRIEYAAPRNNLESIITKIWKDELGLDNIGINDNFFEVGGHSLLLTRVHSRLNKQFERDFPLIDLFTHSTISSLAKYIAGESTEPDFLKNEDRLQKQKEAKQLRRQMHRR